MGNGCFKKKRKIRDIEIQFEKLKNFLEQREKYFQREQTKINRDRQKREERVKKLLKNEKEKEAK